MIQTLIFKIGENGYHTDGPKDCVLLRYSILKCVPSNIKLVHNKYHNILDVRVRIRNCIK